MALRRVARLLAFVLLIGLGLACIAAYYALGVTPAFLVGLAQDALNPPAGLSGIILPAGLQAAVWAEGLESPTSLAFGPDDRLYVAQVTGAVLALADEDGDGWAESRQEFARFNSPLGLAFRGGDLYVGRRGGVAVTRDTDGDGAADLLQELISGLPATRHQTNSLAFGPDGRLYIAQGSTSDRGESGIQPLEASILVADADGANLRVFASGLRNPFDLAFYPGAEALFVTDNGRDVPASVVPDELNLIVEGARYGWPDCWGQNQGPNCEGTLPPVTEFEAHTSADGLLFYTGAMFPEWQGDAFVCLFGANSRDPDIGRSILRVELSQTAEGRWSGAVFDFAAGFAAPLDIAQGPEGALYVTDFRAGVIYRLYRTP